MCDITRHFIENFRYDDKKSLLIQGMILLKGMFTEPHTATRHLRKQECLVWQSYKSALVSISPSPARCRCAKHARNNKSLHMFTEQERAIKVYIFQARFHPCAQKRTFTQGFVKELLVHCFFFLPCTHVESVLETHRDVQHVLFFCYPNTIFDQRP